MKSAPVRDAGISAIDRDIARIAVETRCIAMVGLSPNERRPAWGVARYLKSQGIRVIPVNPGHAGGMILGEKVYADLGEIAEDAAVDLVDIFRRVEAVPDVVAQALAGLPHLRTIWMQLGIRHAEAAAQARARAITVIEDRCTKIEFSRYR